MSDGVPAVRVRLPDAVIVVEVGPRDGLQNESATIPAPVKIAFVERLADAGLPVVEATSFVNPKWVPQLADAEEVLRGSTRKAGVRYPVLVPNERGFERALRAGAEEVAVFASATESFSQRNLNRLRDEAIEMFRPVCARAAEARVRVRPRASLARRSARRSWQLAVWFWWERGPRRVASKATAGSSARVGAPRAAGAFDDALAYATRAEKLDHIFVPKRNLNNLVRQLGSREAVVEEMLRGVAGRTPSAGVFETQVVIRGQTVVARGAVVDGVVKLGTAFGR